VPPLQFGLSLRDPANEMFGGVSIGRIVLDIGALVRANTSGIDLHG
jgi:hypothetical protein